MFVTSSSKIETIPLSGASNPAITLRHVVFPEPDGPNNEKNSPSLAVKFILSSALIGPYDLLMFFKFKAFNIEHLKKKGSDPLFFII